MPHTQPPSQVPGPDARRASRSAASAYWGGPKRMVPRDDAELGEQIKQALWKFAGKTRLPGVRRDQAAVALVRNRFPAARDVFTDQAIAAAIREVADGTCHFCALRVLTAAADTPMPEQPTAGLVALLGQPCARCKGEFAAGEVLERERRLQASGLRRRVTGPQPTGAIWPAGKTPAPSYYTPNPRRFPKV